MPYDENVRQEMQQARTLSDALDFASQFYVQSLATPQGSLARDYLTQRGLDSTITEEYRIGFAPGTGTALFEAASHGLKAPLIETGTVSDRYGRPRDLFRNRVMFPIRNLRGKTIAFGGRTLGDDKAKYINSPESDVFHKSREIYGLYEARQAVRQLDRLLVVEGYMDVIALAQHGIRYAVATLGTATNHDNLSALLKHVRHLVFCFDGDKAGYRAADKAMENVLELMADGLHLQFLMLPDGEDPDTLVRKEGQDAFQQRIDGATPLSRYLFDRQSEGLDLSLPEHRGELRARAEPLLNKMPRSTLRDAMWHEMMRLCSGRQDRQARNKGGKGGWDDRYGKRRDRVQEDRIDVRLSKDSVLCMALLEAPDMATDIAELCRNERQLHQTRNFSDWIISNKLTSQRQLIKALALDPRAHERFYRLFDGIEHIPSRERTLESAREMLSPNQETARKQRLSALLTEKRSLADLSAEERQELRLLSQQARE